MSSNETLGTERLDTNETKIFAPYSPHPSEDLYRRNRAHAAAICSSTTIELLSTVSLTLIVWTFMIFCLILNIIHHARRMQYFNLYDRCTSKNAHFRYDFHIICGRHSVNFTRSESIMIDLLDTHSISTMSIQVPGSTIFNNSQMFMYRHSRSHLRCVQFSIYRRYPIKEVKSIRIAHACSNPDSRLYVYGLDLHDQTNNETKFFPVASVVKYRGTHWALSTSFESKPDINFKKLGVECYDPFGYSSWPIYIEIHTILFFIWCASFTIGHLFSYSDLIILMIITMSIVIALTIIICTVYLQLIKTHITNGHYDGAWRLISILFLVTLAGISIISIMIVSRTRPDCTDSDDNIRWLIGSVGSAILTSVLLLFTYMAALCRRSFKDSATFLETDTNLAKTNSKEGIQFINDPTQNLCASFLTNQETSFTKRALDQARNSGATSAKPVINLKNSKSIDRKVKTANTSLGSAAKRSAEQRPGAEKKTEDDETLDTAFNQGSKLMRVKNRNSISQYV